MSNKGGRVSPDSVADYPPEYLTELWWEYCELQFTLNNETIYTKFKCNKK